MRNSGRKESQCKGPDAKTSLIMLKHDKEVIASKVLGERIELIGIRKARFDRAFQGEQIVLSFFLHQKQPSDVFSKTMK